MTSRRQPFDVLDQRKNKPPDRTTAHTGTGWAKSKRPLLRFLITLTLLMGLFYAAYVPLSQKRLFGSYLGVLPRICGILLEFLGHNITISGRSIVSDTFALEVVGGCDGLEVTALFVPAAVASPVAVRRRVWFILIGTPVFAAVNLLRIVSLFYVALYRPHVVEGVHLDVRPRVRFAVILISGHSHELVSAASPEPSSWARICSVGMQCISVGQGLSYIAPILIWILVAVRLEDLGITPKRGRGQEAGQRPTLLSHAAQRHEHPTRSST